MATATIAPDTGQFQQRITIPTATLRYYSRRWQPSAKGFLNQLGDSFDLEEFLPKYQKCLDDFWSWYVERVKEIEKPILDELEQIRASSAESVGRCPSKLREVDRVVLL